MDAAAGMESHGLKRIVPEQRIRKKRDATMRVGAGIELVIAAPHATTSAIPIISRNRLRHGLYRDHDGAFVRPFFETETENTLCRSSRRHELADLDGAHCIHPRSGADAGLCEEPVAMVRR